MKHVGGASRAILYLDITTSEMFYVIVCQGAINNVNSRHGEANMSAVISEKTQTLDEKKPLISQTNKAEEIAQDKGHDQAKDKERIDSFIKKHKSVLLKLAQ